MDDIIRIINSLEDSGVLIDGVTEIVKHETQQLEAGIHSAILVPMLAALVQLPIYSVVKGISGRGVMTAGRGHYNNVDHMEKYFQFNSTL